MIIVLSNTIGREHFKTRLRVNTDSRLSFTLDSVLQAFGKDTALKL